MKMHLKNLSDIQESRVANKFNAVPHKEDAARILQGLKKQRREMKRARAAVTEERNLAINKDNQVLLSKLIEIQNGKTGTFSA